MPANRSDLTVCADQKLDVPHVLGEAHVLKDEHVVHQPVLLEEVAVRTAAIVQSWLLSHGGEEELQWTRTGTQSRAAQSPVTLSHRHSPAPSTFPGALCCGQVQMRVPVAPLSPVAPVPIPKRLERGTLPGCGGDNVRPVPLARCTPATPAFLPS